MGMRFLCCCRSTPRHRGVPSLSTLFALLAATRCLAAQPEPGVGYVNLDFESGRTPWRVWYCDDRNYTGPRFAYTVDTEVAKSGKASMRIEATRRDAGAFVHQTTDRFTPGVRYELTYWMKVSSSEMTGNCGIHFNRRQRQADGKTRMSGQIKPTMSTRPADDGWIYRRGSFTVDEPTDLLQIGMYVRDSVGTVWFDDIRISEKAEGTVHVDSMYAYYPEQVELGEAMVRRYRALARSHSPLIDGAKAYNELLVAAAFLADDEQRLRRCVHYLGSAGVTADVAAETAAVRDIERELDELYQMYGRLFVAKDKSAIPVFLRAARSLRKRIASERKSFAEKRDAMQVTARTEGKTWKPPPTSTDKDIAISPDGKPNQIVFGTRSPYTHFELEDPLTINRLHTVSALTPSRQGEKKYSFRSALDQWSRLESLGATQSAVATRFAVHDRQVSPAWFRLKYATDPDIFMRADDGAPAELSRVRWPLNTWRDEVREMTVDLLTQLGQTFGERTEFLWYVTAPENSGPYFRVKEGERIAYRSTGYNRSALPDLHDWLRERYETIGELNRQWKTDYKDYTDIRPPQDLCIVGEWERPHPLAYEFQSWRNDHHVAWLRLIYETLKEADPDKPVLGSHSDLLMSLDGSRLFETLDIMGYHHRAPHFMLGTVYIHSLNRFAKKHLGQYECYWGCQEDYGRMGDERVQRRAMAKYLYRLTAWGRHIQVWSYAYTPADYLLKYNGNWFNPVYDLTTLRYCAAALPVGKSKVKRLEHVFLNSTIVPSRVVMIQPNTSMLFQQRKNGESYLEMRQLHDLLFSNNQLYELIPETYFVDGRASFDDFDVVILPYAPFFPDSLAGQLRGWVENGGRLISTGPFGLYDKFGFDKPDLWTEVFGPRMPTRKSRGGKSGWRWAVQGSREDADTLDQRFGKGRVMATLRSLRDPFFRSVAGQQITEAVAASAPAPVKCASNDFEMTLHQARTSELYLCVLNRNVDREVTDTIVLAGQFTRGIDLDVPGGFPIPFSHNDGHTSFTLHLDPGEFTVVALETSPTSN